jgi:hypothetical protein
MTVVRPANSMTRTTVDLLVVALLFIAGCLHYSLMLSQLDSIRTRTRFLVGPPSLLPLVAGVSLLYNGVTNDEGGDASLATLALAVLAAPPLIIVGVAGLLTALLPVAPWRRRVLLPLLALAPISPAIAFVVFAFASDPAGFFRDVFDALRDELTSL